MLIFSSFTLIPPNSKAAFIPFMVCHLGRILSLLHQGGVLFVWYIPDLHGAVNVGNGTNVILGVCLGDTFLKNYCFLDLS